MKVILIKLFLIISIVLYSNIKGYSQKFPFPKEAAKNEKVLDEEIKKIADNVIAQIKKKPIKPNQGGDYEFQLINLFMAQIIVDQKREALETINKCRDIYKDSHPGRSKIIQVQYEAYLKAQMKQKEKPALKFKAAFEEAFYESYDPLDEFTKLEVPSWFINDAVSLKNQLDNAVKSVTENDSISFNQAQYLCRTYNIYKAYNTFLPYVESIFKIEEEKRFIVEENVAIKMKDGGIIPARVVRKKGVTKPLPAVFLFNIYADGYNIALSAKEAALKGYVGIVANLRGQRFSSGKIIPFENDANDTYEVIDWISKQPWSNGKVGMMGGSYLGFTQWAATKKLHPALKTIVPMVSVVPGFDSSGLENGIQNQHMLTWLHFVANKKTVDNEANYDWPRWNKLRNDYFDKGLAFRSLDTVDGHPKELFQKWLDHPHYDKYWQKMVPYKKEFAKINIPVLTTTGYYDGAQRGAMYYLDQHYKYNKNAEHYLVIGPYDHIGGQNRASKNIMGYDIDPVADVDMDKIAYEWFDYIMKGKKKPEILKDKINFQVMGTNKWRHKPSMKAISNNSIKLHFNAIKSGIKFTPEYDTIPQEFYLLSKEVEKGVSHKQKVDFNDRDEINNYHTSKILNDKLPSGNGINFITEEFTESFEISGSFGGELKVTINKKDFDCTVSLYELLPSGEYFKLSHYLGRASYAKDKSKRQLLSPGKKESVPIVNTRMVSKKISRGSRLIVQLNVNKHQFEQLNYGTGKDVSNETIEDAGAPLEVKWHSEGFIEIPIYSETRKEN